MWYDETTVTTVGTHLAVSCDQCRSEASKIVIVHQDLLELIHYLHIKIIGISTIEGFQNPTELEFGRLKKYDL